MTNDSMWDTDRPITRRRLVAASGTALAVGLAGCTEIGLGGEEGDGEGEDGGDEGQEGGEEEGGEQDGDGDGQEDG